MVVASFEVSFVLALVIVYENESSPDQFVFGLYVTISALSPLTKLTLTSPCLGFLVILILGRSFSLALEPISASSSVLIEGSEKLVLNNDSVSSSIFIDRSFATGSFCITFSQVSPSYSSAQVH